MWKATALAIAILVPAALGIAGKTTSFGSNPYQSIKQIGDRDQATFDTKFIQAYRAGAEKSGGLKITTARMVSVNDLSNALRFSVTSTGTMPSNGRALRFRGETIEFLHGDGMATIQAMCFEQVTNCERLDSILAAASETAARAPEHDARHRHPAGWRLLDRTVSAH
jgi:hypothetical protein